MSVSREEDEVVEQTEAQTLGVRSRQSGCKYSCVSLTQAIDPCAMHVFNLVLNHAMGTLDSCFD